MTRIRITEAQAKLLFAREPGKPRAPQVRRHREELPENIVVSQITGFLRAHGWVVTRQHVGLFLPYRIAQGRKRSVTEPTHPVMIGERGAADWRAERPIRSLRTIAPRDAFYKAHQVFYLEIKAPGKKPRPDQLTWLDQREKTGTPATWADSLEMFIRWYKERFA